jgi:protein-S-isoprenylcysteine O-methyltransferase Ste14
MRFLAILSFAACFASLGVRSAYHLAADKSPALGRSKPWHVIVTVLMAVFWFSWFQLNFVDTWTLRVPALLRYAGLVLFAAGVALFVLSHVRMRGFSEQGGLVTTGIYARIRNPMYLGFTIWLIGFPLFMQKLLPLASAPIWIAHILLWKFLEERELQRKYPDYAEYKARTWF